MSKALVYRFAEGLLTVGALLAAFAFATPAHANPSMFTAGTTTKSAATTSPAFMTPGTGTSTLIYDAHAQTFSGGQTFKTDAVGLLIQFTASGTLSTLNLNLEYSQDGIDWYRNFVADPSQFGTTTIAARIAAPFSTTWTYATSSPLGGASAADQHRATAAMIIPSPFRYTRLVSSITGANGAVWAQFVPFKESR
jgi:hypothetical protein